jgi:hypothetical protein
MLRMLAIAGAYLALVALGIQAAHWVAEHLRLSVHHSPETDALWHGVVLVAFVTYVALMALPFVPGVEVGMALLVAFGAEVALLVYLGTVLALTCSFLVGRLVPERILVGALKRLRLRRAHALMSQLQSLPTERRIAVLLEHVHAPVTARALRFRFVAIALALNLPGNAVLGGGGGIAMVAGMSRLCGLTGFVTTLCIAAAPVPAMVALTGTAWLPGGGP